jgi:hypothetical protein
VKETDKQRMLLIGDDNGSVTVNDQTNNKNIAVFSPYKGSKVTIAKFVPGQGNLAILGC